jgi:DNA-binding NarL/FixJ family response regulator
MTHLIVSLEDGSFYLTEDPRLPEDLAAAINAGGLESAGLAYPPPPCARFDVLGHRNLVVAVAHSGPLVKLSPRQRRILAGLQRGQACKEIALDMGISTTTVRSHIRNIKKLLGVKKRASVIPQAVFLGLLAPPKNLTLQGEGETLFLRQPAKDKAE